MPEPNSQCTRLTQYDDGQLGPSEGVAGLLQGWSWSFPQLEIAGLIMDGDVSTYEILRTLFADDSRATFEAIIKDDIGKTETVDTTTTYLLQAMRTEFEELRRSLYLGSGTQKTMLET